MKRKMAKVWRYWPLYLMLLPGMVYLIINNYIPMAGIYLAFEKYTVKGGMFGSKFIGLKNFEFLFKTNDAWIITRNTILYNLAFMTIGTVLPITVGIMLQELRTPLLKRLYQTLILIPFLISMAVVAFLAFAFLSSANGFLNNTVFPLFGLNKIDWYNTPKYWPFILLFVNTWKGIGYSAILYYSTICGIDETLYEAAVVDGANLWQRIMHITLPGLKQTIIILNLMALGNIFRSDFGLFYQIPMNSGVLLEVTNTIDTYVYRGLMQTNNIGMSSAAGVYQSVVGFVLVLSANAVVKKTR